MPPESMRRSRRVPKEIAILLVGSDLEGKVFSEETKTVVLSRHGAGIISQYKLVPEQEMIVRRRDTDKEIEIRVVGQIGSQADNFTYGVAFLDHSINFWGLDFPPLTESEIQANRALLECSSCKRRETVDHTDLEADVFAINDGIVRFCKNCRYSTLWKQASGSPDEADVSPEPLREEEHSPAPIPAPAPQMLVVPPENRRRYVRTKVNCKACVRQAGHTLDVVTCEDMSRGGLRFKSRKQYFQGSTIEVAVPYTPGSNSIFVHARIVYVQELPDEKLFRCGVEYLRSSISP